jgi:hypothetical protein
LLAVDGGVLCLGEFGDLAWLDLSPKGAAVKSRAKLFNAPGDLDAARDQPRSALR